LNNQHQHQKALSHTTKSNRLFSTDTLPANQTIWSINTKKIEGNLAHPCSPVKNTRKSPVSMEKRKSFYVTDDMSLFRWPCEVAASCPTVMRKPSQNTVANKYAMRARKTPIVMGKHRLLIFEQWYRLLRLRRRYLKE
jgi:hypothetical protein